MASTSDERQKQRAATVATDDEELRDALRDAASSVFSTMVSAFEEAEVRALADVRSFDDANSVELADGLGGFHRMVLEREALVRFSGALGGAVVLRCNRGGAEDVARGLLMLGEEIELDSTEIDDALGECANMVAGLFKTKHLDPGGDFALGIPSINGESADGHLCGAVAFRLTNGAVALEIWRDA